MKEAFCSWAIRPKQQAKQPLLHVVIIEQKPSGIAYKHATRATRPRAKTLLHDISMAETEQEATRAFTHFVDAYEDKYPKAVATLTKDREQIMAFYQFPAAHWKHIRSTNVIESIFATVRLRTYKTKGLGTHRATLAMTFTLIQEAQKTWRRIAKWQQLELVQTGRAFKDGVLVEDSAA